MDPTYPRSTPAVNSDELIATEGRHVAVKAQVNADTNEVFVSIGRPNKVRTPAELGDAAFRK